MRFFRTTLVMVLLLAFAGAAVAQVQVQRGGDNPIYKITINVVERTTTAINYQHRSGSTTIDFRGTPLLPAARGEAKVESKQGYIEIEVEFDDLQPATRFGPEFLTYVMWAISPEGRAVNLGEIILNGTKSKLDVTSDLQAFGLIVTAEPYFSVTQPSNVVVMENVIRPETRGKIEQVDAKFELLERGQYTVNVPPAELKPIPLDKKIPLDLFEAQNAVRIARWAGADKDAADSFKKAQDLLTQAENYQARKAGNKPVSMTAREAVQTAEDARLIALKRQEEQRLASERAAAADRENQARLAADRARQEAAAAAQRSAQAEQEQRLEAERRARAEAERALAEADAARTRADAERTRAEADRARLEAEANVARSARDRDAAQADADRARLAAGQAEREKQELRRQLVDQFNKILETRDTARGLIVNMSDVLFDTGKYTLKPGAREKLAKISGIVLAHPGLKLEVEGHTDSVGGEEYNQKLSEQRASSVRDFLISQGVSSTLITARGFGKAQPVASNDTPSGRQQNRRVEMVVSGDIIGNPIGGPSTQQ
ncbi:MAG TPA: OmpA family protein [Terriglobia bacterium]|nr:OmpA family protein [Terriglobia bacterium]